MKIKKLVKKTYLKILEILPIDSHKIVFCNFCGKGYGDNPKYIAEEIKNENLDFKMVWLAGNAQDTFPQYISPVKMWSLRYYYELATAKVIVSNCRVFFGVDKRKGQIYLQTWHAPFSPKKLEKEAIETLKPEYVVDAQKDGRVSDGILSNSSLLDQQYLRAFWLRDEKQILRFGLPRNDFLVNNEKNWDLIETIRKRIDVSTKEYVVLYAPTFRDDRTTEGYKIDIEGVRKAFETRFKRNCKFLIRMHPNVSNQINEFCLNDNVINVTDYPDIQELSLASDAIISDYSSSVFDFALINKPVFICALDLNHYLETRGLLDEFFSFPFPLSQSNYELINDILNFNEKEYFENVNTYFKMNPVYDKGDASRKTVSWICKKIEEAK